MKLTSARALLPIVLSVYTATSAHAQTDYSNVTEDMCLERVCLQQDIASLPTDIQWDNAEAITTAKGLAARNSMVQRGIEICTGANAKQWAGGAKQMCEVLLMNKSLPASEVIAFFKTHKTPVCETGGKEFSFKMQNDLGPTYVNFRFGRDGRPRVLAITKYYVLLNASDNAKLAEMVKEKHPYFSDTVLGRRAPWGGTVEYYDFSGKKGPWYAISADRKLFEKSIGPDEGVCAIGDKGLSIK